MTYLKRAVQKLITRNVSILLQGGEKEVNPGPREKDGAGTDSEGDEVFLHADKGKARRKKSRPAEQPHQDSPDEDQTADTSIRMAREGKKHQE